MYLKQRYNKAFTFFIIFQFIIIIFFIFFPMNSHFNKFRDFYMTNQIKIFNRILEKNTNDLLEKVVANAVSDELFTAIAKRDKVWFEEHFATLTEKNPFEIDSIILLDGKKGTVFADSKRFPLTSEFKNSDLITQALDNIIYQTTFLYNNNGFFVVAVCPVVRSTARFTPNGVLILVQSFDQYFINQKITTFMDQDIFTEVTTNLSPELNKYESVIPITSLEGEVIGNVVLKLNNLILKNIKGIFLRNIIVSMFILFCIFFIISHFLSKKFAQRIELLHSEVENAVRHNFNYKIKIEGEDEIVGLAHSFNSMAKTMHDHVQQIYQTNEKLHNTYLEIIQGLITAIEVKDIYTKGHSQRVMIYSEMIARKMRYPDIELIKMAALLHDIGKIGVPETILNKPDRLTHDEYEIVKAHPDYGYKILSNIEGFNRVKNIIRFHHERIDGKGYPLGMKDIVIPIESRIIAVADTFDAITSDRAYRKGMSVPEAVAELDRVKGIQLDALIVDAFKEVLKENNNFENLLKSVPRLTKDNIAAESDFSLVVGYDNLGRV